MKKLFALLITLTIIFSFSACGDNENIDGSESGSSKSGGSMIDGATAYTVKKCTYTYPSGQETVVYSAELSDETFSMNNLVERRVGEFNRDSMIFDYNGNGITAIRRESQNYEAEVKDRGVTTIKYDADTSTLTKETVRDGNISSKDVYNLVWDSEGRLSSYEYITYYFEYDDKGAVSYESTYEYNYAYAYGEDSFTITSEDETSEYVNDEYREVIKRTVTTVPYEEKSNITTVESFFETDGTTPVAVDYNDKKLEKEVIVSNWWGYEVSDVYYYADGSTESATTAVLTFDDEGKITKYVRETYKNSEVVMPGETVETVTVTIDFTYDETGNLTEMKRTEDTNVESWKFEWMEIPEKLDSQIAMFSGAPHWSVAEFIDNFISFSWEGRITVRTYKLNDFLSYVQ